MLRDESIEAKLRRTEKEVRDLKFAFDQSSIVAFTDAAGTITYVNDRFCEISKYSREELLGKTHQVINSRYHPKEFFIDLWKTISGGKVWTGQIKNRAKDGSYYWVFTTIVPFLNEQNRPYQYVAIRVNITDIKVAEERVQAERASTMHTEKMATLGEMAGGVAHEINNPLAIISGAVAQMKTLVELDNLDIEQLGEISTLIEKTVERIAKITKGLKSFSRDGSRDPFSPIRIEELLEDTLVLCRARFKNNEVELRQKLEVDEGFVFECRSVQITQVLLNLLNNSLDAVHKLDEKWVSIEVRDRGENVEFRVVDSGKGISDEISDKIFNPFFTTKEIGKGTGLGLSISKGIVETHRGIFLLDKDNVNTSFVISLPKKQLDTRRGT